MSVISLTDFQADETCAELHTNDGYADCYTEDEEYDEWDEMIEAALHASDTFGLEFDHVMGAMIGGVWEY